MSEEEERASALFGGAHARPRRLSGKVTFEQAMKWASGLNEAAETRRNSFKQESEAAAQVEPPREEPGSFSPVKSGSEATEDSDQRDNLTKAPQCSTRKFLDLKIRRTTAPCPSRIPGRVRRHRIKGNLVTGNLLTAKLSPKLRRHTVISWHRNPHHLVAKILYPAAAASEGITKRPSFQNLLLRWTRTTTAGSREKT